MFYLIASKRMIRASISFGASAFLFLLFFRQSHYTRNICERYHEYISFLNILFSPHDFQRLIVEITNGFFYFFYFSHAIHATQEHTIHITLYYSLCPISYSYAKRGRTVFCFFFFFYPTTIKHSMYVGFTP